MCKDNSLLAKTRELLSKSEKTYLDIFKATGLTPAWLSSIASGEVLNPSVNKVQRLYEFLSGSKLELQTR